MTSISLSWFSVSLRNCALLFFPLHAMRQHENTLCTQVDATQQFDFCCVYLNHLSYVSVPFKFAAHLTRCVLSLFTRFYHFPHGTLPFIRRVCLFWFCFVFSFFHFLPIFFARFSFEFSVLLSILSCSCHRIAKQTDLATNKSSQLIFIAGPKQSQSKQFQSH